MTGRGLSPELARSLNFLGMFAMIGVIAAANIYQFYHHELPCTLCLLQRLAMIGVAIGAAMNLVLGPDPRHYGVCLVSALFGLCVSIRQTLLHINPFFDKATGLPTLEATANPDFGLPVFGIGLYVWGILIFATVILATGIVALVPRSVRAGQARVTMAESHHHNRRGDSLCRRRAAGRVGVLRVWSWRLPE
jgi:disulfide bond formation protein DsbB